MGDPQIQTSTTARRLGSAKLVRMLEPKDRLKVSCEIAKELGRKKAFQACKRKLAEMLLDEGCLENAAQAASESKHRKTIRKVAIEIFASQMFAGKFRQARATKKKYRLSFREEKEAVASLDASSFLPILKSNYFKPKEKKELAKAMFETHPDTVDFSGTIYPRPWGCSLEKTLENLHQLIGKPATKLALAAAVKGKFLRGDGFVISLHMARNLGLAETSSDLIKLLKISKVSKSQIKAGLERQLEEDIIYHESACKETEWRVVLEEDEIERIAIRAFEKKVKEGSYRHAREIAEQYGLRQQLLAIHEIQRICC